MIVYIEYAILDNMVIDSILLYLVAITMRFCVRWWRIILASVVGTVCALVVPLLAVWIGYIVKVVCVVAMCMVCFGRDRIAVSVLLLVVYTFALGGVIVGLLALLGVDYSIYSVGNVYYSSVPIGMYLLAVVLCIVLCMLVVCYINNHRATASNVVDIVLLVSGQHIACTGYIDSGNMLVVDNTAVCFACGNVGKKVRHYIAQAVIGGNAVHVRYNTVSDSKQAIAVRANIEIEDNIKPILLCVARGSSVHGCDVLINYKLMEG